MSGCILVLFSVLGQSRDDTLGWIMLPVREVKERQLGFLKCIGLILSPCLVYSVET